MHHIPLAPAHPAGSASILPKQDAPAAPVRAAETHDILLIEDEPVLRVLLRDFLRHQGYSVIEAPNGRVALRALAEHPVRLILTDIFMPEVDGLEVLRSLRRQDPERTIIAMSGYVTLDPRLFLKVAEHLGATRTLTKPFAFDQLLNAVHDAIGWPQ